MTRAFGERVRGLRIATDLSKDELAVRCGVPRPTIIETEAGSYEPRLSLILTLCDGLGVSPDGLMGDLVAASVVSGAVESRVQANLASLTPREREVFEGLTRADANAEIALDLQISVETVHTHVANIEQISSGGTITYLHHDQQGSTRLLTGSTGTVTGKCTYSAYGHPSATTPNTPAQTPG